jgi:hypothetical protein
MEPIAQMSIGTPPLLLRYRAPTALHPVPVRRVRVLATALASRQAPWPGLAVPLIAAHSELPSPRNKTCLANNKGEWQLSHSPMQRSIRLRPWSVRPH